MVALGIDFLWPNPGSKQMLQNTIKRYQQKGMPVGSLQAETSAPVGNPPSDVNKWAVLRAIVAVRKDLGLSGQSTGVLEALLSFFPSDTLSTNDMLMVFPSNKKLCERSHGISEATLRRHLAALVQSGLIARKDSPNGKRYGRTGPSGTLTAAYGFSLHPLLARATEIIAAAERASERATAIKFARGELTIAKRECLIHIARLLEIGDTQNSEQLSADLEKELAAIKRSSSLEDIQVAITAINRITTAAFKILDQTSATSGPGSAASPRSSTLRDAPNLSGNGAQNERHKEHKFQVHVSRSEDYSIERELNLTEILNLCPSLKHYASERITSWRSVFSAVDHARKCMGIHKLSWARSAKAMGGPSTLLAVCTMLNKVQLNTLSNPGGYLTHLSKLHLTGDLCAKTLLLRLRKTQLQVG